ncbi:MAG: metallophosphoesterase family protein [Proteobacteria bacterium]|jgi:predicted phosphodiesterase|nr:metallophosphoesterase family protein [Pseudomonadota bacterium]
MREPLGRRAGRDIGLERGSSPQMKFAVLSDIHGNYRALDAVLADVNNRGVDGIVNLGDCFYGPFDPQPVAKRLVDSRWPTVAGNEDRCLLEPNGTSRCLRFTQSQLTQYQLEWLGKLPLVCKIPGFAWAFHGTPSDDSQYLLHTVDGVLRQASKSELTERIRGRRATEPGGPGVDSEIGKLLFLCGHDHTPKMVENDGRIIVNPGSVGCPAYFDDSPRPHVVANGQPHARYAIVSRQGEQIDVELIAVAYDWDAAAAEAAENGFFQWANWLRTGWAAPPVQAEKDVADDAGHW